MVTQNVAAAGAELPGRRVTEREAWSAPACGSWCSASGCCSPGSRWPPLEGAVGIVQLALQRLQEEGVVELDEERKAAMVSNLLVVPCSEQATQQVVNTGSLYQ